MQSENGGQNAPFDLSRVTRRAAWLFPLVAWLFATLFLLGDYGWWNDDYFFNQRHPETGAYDSVILTRRQPEFPPSGHILPWRPLHLTGTAALVTVFWDRPWVVHTTGALIHLLCAGTLLLFLLRLRLSVHAALGVVTLHLVHASHYQAVLWASSLVTAAASAALFLGLTAMVEYGRTRRVWFGAVVPLMALLIAGFYEQPGGCLPVLALAYVAGMLQREAGAEGSRWGRMDLVRAAWPTGAALAVMMAYTLNVRYNSGPGLGGDAASYAPLAQLPSRLAEVLRSMIPLAEARDLWLGSLSLGLSAVFEHPGRGVLFVLAMGASGLAAVHAWATTRTHEGRSGAGSLVAGLSGAVLGAALAVGACLPLSAINGYNGNSRTFYLVCACGLASMGGLADLFGFAVDRAGRIAGPVRLVCALLVIGLTGVGSLMYVGVQQRYALVYRANERQAAQLRELAPDPPAHAVMLPLADYSRAFSTRQASFDRGLENAWVYTWQNWFFLKNIYRRDDVHTFFHVPGRDFIAGISVEEIRLEWAMDTPYRGADGSIQYVAVPLANVVPFVIDPDGNVRLVTRWNIRPKDGGLPFAVEPPYCVAGVGSRRVPPFEFEWPAPASWPMRGR